MKLENIFNDRKSYTRTDSGASVNLVHLVISVPNKRKLFGGDTLSAVDDRYFDRSVEYLLLDLDCLVGTALIYRIVYKIVKHL